MDKTDIYNNLPTKIQSLYDASDPSCAILSEVSEKYELEQEKHVKFIILIGDVILGLEKTDQLLVRLTEKVGVSPETASNILTELDEFLIPVHEFYGTSAKKRPEATAEDSLNSNETIPTLRTMEDDVDKVHGYGAYRELYPHEAGGESEPTHSSSQEDALARQKLASLPSYDVKGAEGKE